MRDAGQFDYVVAGGGSAGSALASRLTENPDVTVCLVEAGGEGRDILIRAPLGAITMLPGYGRINNWAYHTVPQPGLNGRRGYQPRGPHARRFLGHQRDALYARSPARL